MAYRINDLFEFYSTIVIVKHGGQKIHDGNNVHIYMYVHTEQLEKHS